jgi:alcohol dehydrogenase, propanol-preferring
MKAMLLEQTAPVEDRPLVLREVPDPAPGFGQVRIRVSVCGLCHTDLHTVEGELNPLPTLPLIPGHQIVGVVDRVGAGVSGPVVGDRVGLPWLHETCGRCPYCLRGDENLCPESRYTGYHASGGYAEYTVAPADFVYPLPVGVSDEQAAPLLCAGIVGYRAVRLSNIRPGQRFGIIGFGASAHIAIQVVRHWGCEVAVFSRTRDHLAHADELGAAWAGRLEETPPWPLDGLVVFAPAGEVVPRALELMDRGGTVALAGIYMTPIPEMDYERYLFQERVLRSVTAATRRDARELLDLAAEIPIRTTTDSIPLEEANAGLLAMKQSRFRGTRVLRVRE